jgi:hypothetical protein
LSNHTPPITKRQRIRDLILAKAKTKDIVDQVGTTREYVYKEKGKLKQKGLLATHQSLSISDGQNEITVVKGQPDLVESVDRYRSVTLNRSNDYDIPPLNKKDLMLMYDDFEDAQKGPVYAIAKHGIHPEISQKEFDRFVRMKARDPFDLQQKLTAGISNASPNIQSLINKSSSTLLTNDEILSIVEHKMLNYAYLYLRQFLGNRAIPLPGGLYGVPCRVCHKRMPGLIYDINSAIGGYAKIQLGTEHLCDDCLPKHITPSG